MRDFGRAQKQDAVKSSRSIRAGTHLCLQVETSQWRRWAGFRERERGQMKAKLVKSVRHLRFRVRLSNVDSLLASLEMKAAVNL